MPDGWAFRKVRGGLSRRGTGGYFGLATTPDTNRGASVILEKGVREMSESKLVTIGKFTSINEAEFARMLLDGEGIRATIADATTGSMLVPNVVGWFKLDVAAEDAERAREVFVEARRAASDLRDQSGEGLACLACGKEMPLGVAECPDCGWTYLGSGE
jgi:hypothetical protein